MLNSDNKNTVIPKSDMEATMHNNTIKGILSRVFKIFMVSYGKDKTPVWNKLMDTYVSNPNNNIPLDRSKQTSAKGNAKREYLAPNLSWAKFCEAMRFGNFKDLKIVFYAQDENGVVMSTKEYIDFASLTDLDFATDVIDKRVKTESSIQAGDEGFVDARTVIAERRRSPMSRGSDWLSKPPVDVVSVISNHTLREPAPEKKE